MTDEQFWAARQYLAERTYGMAYRASQRAEIQAEQETRDNIRKVERMVGQPIVNTPAVIPPRPITDEVIG